MSVEATISTVVADPDSELWFPAITDKLVASAIERKLKPIGLSTRSYSTSRVVAKSGALPRVAVFTRGISGKTIVVEDLERDIKDYYEICGLTFLSAGEIDEATQMTIGDALTLLGNISTIGTTLASLVKSMHLLRSQDPSIDVSHSDPNVPFSIFLSTPPLQAKSRTIRVAESIVHESMHLNLTLIDDLRPLTIQSDNLIHSPWRMEPRPPLGVLHGMYVFTVVAQVLQIVRDRTSTTGELGAYLSRRLSDIAGELAAAGRSLQKEYLTETGRLLLSRLREDRRRLLRAP